MTLGTLESSRLTPREARTRFRSGEHRGPTTGFATGFCQANLVIVPAAQADAFEAYCRFNPQPCPLIERLLPGDPEPRGSAPGADLRTDLPRYRVYSRGGSFEERIDITGQWRDDAVGFLLGCSFTFESALTGAGLVPRYLEEGTNVPMFRTDRATVASGPFAGPLVVSMRPVPADRVAEAIAVTAPFIQAHGAPVYHGDPAGLGIGDLKRPDFGDPSTIRPGEVPVFWACGVTSQTALLAALASGAIPWAITHAPGHMLVTDLPAAAARAEPGS
jgi:uncharacterized protein YcsI (UPF0317 family)